jgi:hypothetical protein
MAAGGVACSEQLGEPVFVLLLITGTGLGQPADDVRNASETGSYLITG